MIRASLLAASVALGLSAATASAASLFVSPLSGGQEVPPTEFPRLGNATYVLMGAGTATPSLSFELLFDSIFNFDRPGSIGTQMVTRLHIHQAPRGANGGIVFGIIDPDNDADDDVVITVNPDGSTRITGEWDTNEGNGGVTFADFAAIFSGAAPGDELPFYLNLHTFDFPAGAIRGQISAVPLPAGAALLLGALGLLTLVGRARPRRMSRR